MNKNNLLKFMTKIRIVLNSWSFLSEKVNCSYPWPVVEGEIIYLECKVVYSGPWPPDVKWIAPDGVETPCIGEFAYINATVSMQQVPFNASKNVGKAAYFAT